jgi:hypothetical protein
MPIKMVAVVTAVTQVRADLVYLENDFQVHTRCGS